MFSTKSLPQDPVAAPAVRSIASVAVGVSQIERAEPFQCQSEIALSQALFQHEQGRLLHAATVTANVRGFTLENVVLDTETFMICKDGALIEETAVFTPLNARAPFDDPGVPPPEDDDSDIILGYNPLHFRYLNWVTQCLPAIDWCLRQQKDRPVRLLLPPLASWQEEFLRLLGCDRIPRLMLERNTRYRLKRLHMAEFLFGVHNGAVSKSLRQTLDRIVDAVPAIGPTAPVLYIPGSHYYYGALGNEAELVKVMGGAGVGVIIPTLSVAARVNLMRNAQVVIGPLSHALTDIGFCRPRSLLWEMMPRHHIDPSINRIAQSGGMDYLADVFPVAAGPAVPGEWQVDMALVQHRLQQVNERLGRIAAARAQPAPSQQMPIPRAPLPQVPPPPAPVPIRQAHAAAPSFAAVAPPSPVVQPFSVPAAAPAPTAQPFVAPPQPAARGGVTAPALARDFESLGDASLPELAQPDGPGTPSGLLQAAWFDAAPDARLEWLVAALEQGFEGLGSPGTISIVPETHDGQAVLVAHDTTYGLRFQLGLPATAAAPEVAAADAAGRLSFLRHKLIDDMLSGRKVWVWHAAATTHPSQLQPLLRVLRRLGPNVLLWVSTTEDRHQASTIDPLADDFLHGYVASVAGGGADPGSWRAIRAMAERWLSARATGAADAALGPFAPIEAPATAPGPVAALDADAVIALEEALGGEAITGLAAESLADAGIDADNKAPEIATADETAPEATDMPSPTASAPTSATTAASAMEYLARNPAAVEAPRRASPPKRSFFGRLFGG